MEHDGDVVLQGEVEVAHRNMARSHCLEVNDVSIARGFVGPGRPTKFAQEHTADVFGIDDAWGALNQFATFNNVEPNFRGIWNVLNVGGVNACPWSVSPQMKSTGGNGHVGILHPMEPSISNSSNLLSSTAYSMGSSRVNGSKKPLTMRPMASSSEKPRLMR